MFPVVSALLACLAAWFRSRRSMQLEILALRHQVAVYQRSVPRPRILPTDRLLWVWLAHLWSGWQAVLAFVQPRTVIAWQKQRFRDYWRRLSQRGKLGRPAVSKEVRELIQDMWRANPTWGSPRIVGELRKLGLAHDRRRIVHFNITEHPTAQWTTQQIVEAFPWDEAPRYLLRDRDAIYGEYFQQRVGNIGIEEVKIAPRSPWQNPYCERVIGSIRRDLLDHVIVLNERHLTCLLTEYVSYYHRFRTHLSLEMDCPEPRAVDPPEAGAVIAVPELGGLNHHYERHAA